MHRSIYFYAIIFVSLPRQLYEHVLHIYILPLLN